MKKYCLLILFLFGVFLFANDLLFEANFDQFTLDANIGKGGTKCLSFSNPDLQMRMFPGINNKGNSVNLENREFCSYNALGNINPQQGTVTVWVAPVNWKPSEKKIQVFFDTFINNGKMRLMLLKNQYANCFYAVITHKDAPGSQKNFQATQGSRADD